MDLGEVLIRVLPIAIAGALSPFNVTVIILMLLSKDRPIARSIAFILGFCTSLVLIGTIVIGIVSTLYAPPLQPRAYVIIMAVGGVLVVLGARQLIAHIDPDEPPKEWLVRISKFRPFTTFWVGFFLSGLGIKTLGLYVACLSLVTTAGLSVIEVTVILALVVLIMVSTMLIPVIIYIVFPERGAHILGELYDRLQRSQHRIAGSLLVIVGGALILLGLDSLL